MTTREDFVARWGEDAALALEAAAEEHANGINDGDRGSDPFKWVLIIVIGYQCAEIPMYRSHHGITTPAWDELHEWMVEEADLGTHEGDVDYLSLAAGKYEPYARA